LPRLPDACHQLVERLCSHLNSSRISWPSNFDCPGVRSPCSFFA
jgi:hypothetical protein